MNCILVLLVKYLITFGLSVQENENDENVDKSIGIPFCCHEANNYSLTQIILPKDLEY